MSASARDGREAGSDTSDGRSVEVGSGSRRRRARWLRQQRESPVRTVVTHGATAWSARQIGAHGEERGGRRETDREEAATAASCRSRACRRRTVALGIACAVVPTRCVEPETVLTKPPYLVRVVLCCTRPRRRRGGRARERSAAVADRPSYRLWTLARSHPPVQPSRHDIAGSDRTVRPTDGRPESASTSRAARTATRAPPSAVAARRASACCQTAQ